VREPPDPPDGISQPREPRAAGPVGFDEADRLRLSDQLRSAGASEAELEEAAGTGTMGVLALDLALRPPGEMVAFAEAAATAGLSEEEAAGLWRALGFAVPTDGSLRLTRDEAATLVGLVGLGRQVVGEERGLGFARVLGSATAAVAEALVDAFRVQIEMPRLQAGEKYSNIVEDYTALARASFPTFVQGLGVLTRAHMLRVARGAWAPDERHSAVTRQQTIGFADLVGYTGHSRALSSTDLAVAMGHFETRVTDLVSRFGGRLVKFIGDEAMFVVVDPVAGCGLALALAEMFTMDPELPPLRVGLAQGPAVALHGDYYGEVVNLAARLVKRAEPSQVVVSESVRSAAADSFAFEVVQSKALKGFDDRVPAFLLSGERQRAPA
jgi:adenylate cyclase